MFIFPESETGYYEDELSYYAHDREMESAEQEREDRLEAQAEEMLAIAWAGDNYLSARLPQLNAENGIDPETRCTATEMKEEEIDRIYDRPQERRVA